MSIKFNKIGGFIGAEVTGVTLGIENDPSVFQELREGLNTHGVIVFRNQEMDVEQFMRFGQGFGPLFVNNSPATKAISGYPMVEDMRKEADEKTNIGDEWHTDQSNKEHPCWMTILHGIDIPPFGGNTSFLSTAAAYDALPESLKTLLGTLEAEHSSEFILRNAIERMGNDDNRFNLSKATARAIHPVVKKHPETGRKVIYVNPGYTSHFVGWTRDDSRALLDVIYRHALRQEFVCHVKWQPGTVAIWDNRQTWHYASNDYQGHRREMRRIVVNPPTTA